MGGTVRDPGAGGAAVVGGSGVHGTGAFAARPIRAGEPVLTQRGRVVRTAELSPAEKALMLGPDLWLEADPADPHPSDEVNHACDPNLGFRDGTLEMVALRDIAAGDELSFHYSTAMDEPGWGFPCRCGSGGCAGEVRGWSEISAAQRERLRPWALGWLKER
jgi:SET domain-containing protein